MIAMKLQTVEEWQLVTVSIQTDCQSPLPPRPTRTPGVQAEAHAHASNLANPSSSTNLSEGFQHSLNDIMNAINSSRETLHSQGKLDMTIINNQVGLEHGKGRIYSS